MTSTSHRGAIKYLGSLRGIGHLITEGGDREPGAITYEIDGFLDRTHRSAAGRIEGDSAALVRAFQAERAQLTLDGGQ